MAKKSEKAVAPPPNPTVYENIEAALDNQDRDRLRKVFETSKAKLAALIDKPGKGKAPAQKAMKAYELTGTLLDQLFALKAQMEASLKAKK
jgi:hypothetical protein